MKAYYRIRGVLNEEFLADIDHVVEIVDHGRRIITSFEDRNPWIGRNSVDGPVFVLVDPEVPIQDER